MQAHNRSPEGQAKRRREYLWGALWSREHELLRREEAREIARLEASVKAQYQRRHAEVSAREAAGEEPPGWHPGLEG